MTKKTGKKAQPEVNTEKSGDTYIAGSFSIEIPQTRSKTSGQEYSRDFLPDARQYSTSGRIEKSLTYVIKRK